MNSKEMIFFFLLINQFIQIIHPINLRCYDDNSGSFYLIEHCRACVIFIDIKVNTAVLQRKFSIDDIHQYRYRRHTDTVVHQSCAQEYDGPLYGYNQTHCYCNSHLCNSNIQRCIYEIASTRYFSCYHGSNSSRNSLEIYKKCRSCRIKKESALTYHYECLTFGEQEQKSETHCTCQHPMCNQDFAICQRFQQIPSQPRVNSIDEIVRTSIKIINSTIIPMTLSTINQTEQEYTTENATLTEITTGFYNETNQTIVSITIEQKNHAKSFSLNTFFYFFPFMSVFVV
jgi:hypothetical protein